MESRREAGGESRDAAWGRRDLLRWSAGALALGAFALGPGRAARGAEPAMLMRRIPSSGEMIPAVGLGTSDAFEVGTDAAERAPLREVLRIFHGAGGRLIDSSPMYGTAESVIGDLLKELNLNTAVFRATKVWSSGREAGIRQMGQSERRMGGVRIDLMQVHNLLDTETHLATLREWKAAGRIRYLGVTHYRAAAFGQLEPLIRSEKLDFVQLNYSIAEPDAEARLLPLAVDKGTAVLVNRPFADGGLFRRTRGQAPPDWAKEFDCASWAQFFLKYVLAHPAVTCAIPATSKPHHAEDNMRGGLGGLPSEAQRAQMRRLIERL